MQFQPTDAVILIPSLEPDERLPAYAAALLDKGFTRLVIVDDGSGEAYQPIFRQLAAMDGVTVLHHEVNMGKGAGLKTGYAYIQAHMPGVPGVITADSDGQHTVEDCWKLAQALCQGKDEMYLGSRDFSQANVPPKSRFGNRTTSLVFKLLYGQWLPDTQTGLRAFPAHRLGFMQQVSGERFEYEMNVLIACARDGMPMVPITIETIYENENAGTHFHPIRDSYRIYKVILGSFIKFMGASIASFLIDNGVFTLLDQLFLTDIALGRVALASILARLVSAPCNFLMNRNLVFKVKGNTGKTALRYAILCIGVLLCSAGSLAVLSALGMPKVLDTMAKVVIDALLYLVSYRVQNKWVFQEEKSNA